MKRLKNFWNNNRVLFVLTSIIIICFLIMLFVCVKYFFGVNSSNYGDRLESIQNLSLSDEDKSSIVTKLQENEAVIGVNVHTQGKIIYIRVVVENITLEKAKEIANTSLEVIAEEYQKNYDIHYTLVSEEKENVPGFIIMGAKNINRSMIIWNNNTPVTQEE